jgi:uncharacterized protein
MNEHTFVHFEIPADSLERAKTFYQEVFGWRIESIEGFPNYWGARVSDDDSDLHGAVYDRSDGEIPTPLFYIGVDSVDATLEKLRAEGGTVTMPKQAVPSMGWFAVFKDPEGNLFGIWQSDPEAH